MDTITDQLPWLTLGLQDKIIVHSLEGLAFENPIEVCGVIMEVDGAAVLMRSENCSPTPQTHFVLHPEVWAQAQSGKCLAVYHSHPNATAERKLSFSDLAMANQFKVPVLVWHYEGLWDYYDPLNPNPYPLVAKPYQPTELEFYVGWVWDWGRVCCGRLIYHYYLGMLGIELDMPTTSHHGSEVLAAGWDKYRESLVRNGFVEVQELRQNDIVLMSLRCANAHHGAIVVDAEKELLLHITEPGDFSHLERYHSDLKNKTVGIWRHPKFV